MLTKPDPFTLLLTQALAAIRAGPPMAPQQKRLARLTVLLSRAALGLPSTGQAASSRLSLGHSPRSGIESPVAAADATGSQQVTDDSGEGRRQNSAILRGLAQLTLQGDAMAEQALAEALSTADCPAGQGCAPGHCVWHMQ